MNKLRDNRGETLIESLVSVLIAVLAFSTDKFDRSSDSHADRRG